MKKSFKVILPIFFICIILLSVLYLLMHNNTDLPENTLQKAFKISDAVPVSSDIYIWGTLSGEINTAKRMQELSRELADALDVKRDSSYVEKFDNNDYIKKLEIRGNNKQGCRIKVAVQNDKTSGKGQDINVSVDVIRDGLVEDFKNIRESILSVFDRYGIKPEVNLCITGSYNEKLDTKQLNNMCSKILGKIEAKKVEGIREGNLISVSAYSPVIGSSIVVNGNKVNLNVAIRYNSNEGKTYIWIATPVITTEY